ncbi:GTPase [Haloparvum sp. AD34]
MPDETPSDVKRILIMGAAGRDFHDFNTCFRGRDDVEVVAFTRAPGQNLGEATDDAANGDDADEADDARRYPAELAGEGYPDGIPILPEADLEALIRGDHPAVDGPADEPAATNSSPFVDRVVFSYSDVSHEHVMHAASRAVATGADFGILGRDRMQLSVDVPVVAVDAVRTGCGKSAHAREVATELADRGNDVAVVREPMPYGDLVRERVQRFATMDDLDEANLTLEEREEYEWHVDKGHVVFAGVDYADVFAQATDEADVLVWDGGNNELPFVDADVNLVLADPTRPGHERRYHPGEANLRSADEVCLTKLNSALPDDVATVTENVRELAPDARILRSDSVITVEDPERVRGARVLALEDGPTVTHGEAKHGAAMVAAHRYGAGECVDPEPHAVGSIADALAEYDHLDRVLPAMGYTDEQIAELEETIRGCDADLVLAGTPCDVQRVLEVDTPILDVDYRFEPVDWSFGGFLDRYADRLGDAVEG